MKTIVMLVVGAILGAGCLTAVSGFAQTISNGGVLIPSSGQQIMASCTTDNKTVANYTTVTMSVSQVVMGSSVYITCKKNK